VFNDLKNVKIAKRSLKICLFWPILGHFMNLNHILKKVGRRSDQNWFVWWGFRNLHALRYPKTGILSKCENFWVNSSLSMMWRANCSIVTVQQNQTPDISFFFDIISYLYQVLKLDIISYLISLSKKWYWYNIISFSQMLNGNLIYILFWQQY
jgi:hypothetical protein